MTPKEFQIHLQNLSREVQQFMDRDGPEIAANIAVEKFKENFEQEGFFGKKWKEVQRRTPGTKANKYLSKKHPADTQRKILAGRTGNLRNSINYRTEPGKAIVFSDTAYGKYHNKGDGKIPKRQFIGENQQLTDHIGKELEKRINKMFNG